MKKLYSKNSAILIIIICLFACQKTSKDNGANPKAIIITASVAGRVTDLNNAPVSGASVTAGASTTHTDADGQFSFKDIQLDKDAGFIKVIKTDHFTGSRTFLVNGSTTNNVKIQMIPKTVSATIASSSGGNVAISGGAKINIAAGSFVNAGNNTAYAGQVSVAGYYLNPADSSLSDSKPGDLRGISTANKEGILKSFGMLSVEMNDGGGQQLQLATGKPATITIPIPLTMQAVAPAIISLWYFDETKGIWKEEGTATKQGSGYTGTVTHFSFWSAGQLEQGIKLTARFIDATGNAQGNKLVWIIRPQNETISVRTDNAGTISLYVPANEILVLDAIDDCGDLMFKQYVGPFSNEVNLGNLTVNGSGVPVNFTLSGTAVNCSHSPITKGLAKVIISNHGAFTSAISNGTFSIRFTNCINSSNSAELTVYDSVTNLVSNAYPVTINSANQNVGQITISTCPPVSDSVYVRLILNGTSYSWMPPNVSGAIRDTSNNTLIQASGLSQSMYFYILNDNASPGNYPIILSAVLNGISYPNNSAATTITEYGTPGGFIVGSASGQMKAQDTTYLPFSMTYRVRRTQ